MHRPNVAVVTAWCKEKYEISLFFFVWPDKVQAGEELWLDYGYVSAVAKNSCNADLPLHSEAGSVWPSCKDDEDLHDALQRKACMMQEYILIGF